MARERAVLNGRTAPEECWKDTFDTMPDASAEAARRKRRTGRDVRPYRCVYCERYHLTSSALRLSIACTARQEAV